VSILQLPDFNHEFTIECDASGSGLDVVLHQGAGPVAFFSRALAPHHTKLAAYERELIGLVQAVHHYSLKFLLDQCLLKIPQHQ
jgi:hypothetical protein